MFEFVYGIYSMLFLGDFVSMPIIEEDWLIVGILLEIGSCF